MLPKRVTVQLLAFLVLTGGVVANVNAGTANLNRLHPVRSPVRLS